MWTRILLALSFSLSLSVLGLSHDKAQAVYNPPPCNWQLPNEWLRSIKNKIPAGEIDWANANTRIIGYRTSANQILVIPHDFEVTLNGSGATDIAVAIKNTSGGFKAYHGHTLLGSNQAPPSPNRSWLAPADHSRIEIGNNVTNTQTGVFCIEFIKGETYVAGFWPRFNSRLPFANGEAYAGANFNACVINCEPAAAPTGGGGSGGGAPSDGLTDSQLRATPVPVTGVMLLDKPQLIRGAAFLSVMLIGLWFAWQFRYRGGH